ncbi:two-component system sensor histidine kinase NtrB [Pajaroellobacter abortibovis]|uniref:histidine kinase n=1 Tax=Pajaroellobacter abortibovis TaxID=1882918 RepID=A0A1L6MWV2_9BACT|nr:ATP-binding protein [Pajaroellobacter abortibovis]APS00014.1 hypothetical protein BCY86_04430 [Pajaroellobacter abortibovis]
MISLQSAWRESTVFYFLVGLYFAFLWAKSRKKSHYLIFSFLCFSLVEYLTTQAIAESAISPQEILKARWISHIGLAFAFTFIFHFTLAYKENFLPYQKYPKWIPYSVNLFLIFISCCSIFFYQHSNSQLFFQDLQWIHEQSPVDALDLCFYIFGLASSAFSLIYLSQSYLLGQQEVLPTVIGSMLLTVSLIQEIGRAFGILSQLSTLAVGWSVFILGAMMMFGQRSLLVVRELELSHEALKIKNRELKKAYDHLAILEQKLSHREQLAVVGELAAVIAHEVRNPLAIISNAVANLRKENLSKTDYSTLLSILDEETNRLNHLVKDLLCYARPINIQRTFFSLKDLIESGLRLAHPIDTIKVKFLVETSYSYLWGDPNHLRQVFDNLIKNAVQAMQYGGTLTIYIRTASQEKASGIAIDIVDTGEGMDTQIRSRALDPFFTTRPSGTGLGLTIVNRIIEAHGGQLLIDSYTGAGTKVTVFLPFGSENSPPNSQPLID